jgi:hypothetical protein
MTWGPTRGLRELPIMIAIDFFVAMVSLVKVTVPDWLRRQAKEMLKLMEMM